MPLSEAEVDRYYQDGYVIPEYRLSSSTVFISFSGSFPPSNFFTASIKSRDLVLSKGAGFALFVGVPESFLTGI